MADIAISAAEGPGVSTATVGDFIALLKPRVMVLVVFTGLAGLLLAPGHVHPFLAAVAVASIALASGAAGAINMWWERDIDALMRRTAGRPLPQGRVNPSDALAFGVILTLLSVALMGLALNWLAAGLLAAASAFYIFIYTIWLKRRTPQNIVIGGAAGAFPPVIGWAAVSGDAPPAAWALFLLIFLWTPPHFWALALYACKDYARAGVPMLPVVAGETATRRQILGYAILMVASSFLPFILNVAGPVYLCGASALGAMFLIAAIQLRRAPSGDEAPARRLFTFSILYLFLIFTLLVWGRA